MNTRPAVREVEIVAKMTPMEIVVGARVVGFSKLYCPFGDVAAGMVQRSIDVEVMISRHDGRGRWLGASLGHQRNAVKAGPIKGTTPLDVGGPAKLVCPPDRMAK